MVDATDAGLVGQPDSLRAWHVIGAAIAGASYVKRYAYDFCSPWEYGKAFYSRDSRLIDGATRYSWSRKMTYKLQPRSDLARLDFASERGDRKTVKTGSLSKTNHSDVCPASHMSTLSAGQPSQALILHLTTLPVCGLPSGLSRLLHLLSSHGQRVPFWSYLQRRSCRPRGRLVFLPWRPAFGTIPARQAAISFCPYVDILDRVLDKIECYLPEIYAGKTRG
jgi:hypothetical protein